jgi:hypothetical protein
MHAPPNAPSFKHPSPPPLHPEETQLEDGAGGYFDLPGRREDASPRVSIDGSPLSADSTAPSPAAASLAALQYLPVPLLVLSSTKTVVLANEAMGKLLGVHLRALQNIDGEVLSITDVLQGQTIARLGIEILQHGSPILISWEV